VRLKKSPYGMDREDSSAVTRPGPSPMTRRQIISISDDAARIPSALARQDPVSFDAARPSAGTR
jgi:hypothetical protein